MDFISKLEFLEWALSYKYLDWIAMMYQSFRGSWMWNIKFQTPHGPQRHRGYPNRPLGHLSGPHRPCGCCHRPHVVAGDPKDIAVIATDPMGLTVGLKDSISKLEFLEWALSYKFWLNCLGLSFSQKILDVEHQISNPQLDLQRSVDI
jgi:hypothetical protein